MLGVQFMKHTVPILAASALTWFIEPAIAADEQGNANSPAASDQSASFRVTEDRRASTILGMKVENLAGEDLGTVEDMVLRLAHGRITAVVLSTGGFLGMGDELSIVPPQSLKMDMEKKVLRLDTNKESLMKAPRFQASKWPDLSDKQYMSELYEAYKVKPYMDTRARQDIVPAEDSTVLKASEFLKSEVKNLQGEELGSVSELVLDENLSHITSVVVSFGGFLGMGNDLTVVPIEAFTSDGKGDTLQMNATRETLAKAPHFKAGEWPQRFAEPSYADRVYGTFNMKRHPDGSLTAMDQASDDKAIATTRDIRKMIVDTDELSFSSKNIQIVNQGGKVTLMGKVPNQAEEKKILEIAEKIAGKDRVINQLEVNKD